MPPRYIARSEQSLQIEWDDVDLGSSTRTSARPDGVVYNTGGRGVANGGVLVLEAEPDTQTLIETVDLRDDFIPAVVIRELDKASLKGRVVARIEVLSPTNKLYNKSEYQRARNNALYSSTVLVEIDYLHESEPVPRKIPRYPQEPDSFTYHLHVNDPRPSLEQGTLTTYSFCLRMPLLKIRLPLAGEDAIALELNPVYQHTFRFGCWGSYINYLD